MVATFGEVNIGICRRFPIKIPYLFLGHNRSYLFVNVDVVDVNRKKTDVRSMSPIDLINCFTFDTFLLKICCFAKLDMKRKKRSTATMPFILNREYKFFIVGNLRVFLLRRDSGDSINHLNYHSSYPYLRT